MRTIKDLYNLNENDPWDSRSDEQKKIDAKFFKKFDKVIEKPESDIKIYYKLIIKNIKELPVIDREYIDCGMIENDAWFLFVKKVDAVFVKHAFATFETDIITIDNKNVVYSKKEKRKEEREASKYLFCVKYLDETNGSIVYIVLRSAFEQEEKISDIALNINELLPLNLIEISPGVYQNRDRLRDEMYKEMVSYGFSESFDFQLYINSLT